MMIFAVSRPGLLENSQNDVSANDGFDQIVLYQVGTTTLPFFFVLFFSSGGQYSLLLYNKYVAYWWIKMCIYL